MAKQRGPDGLKLYRYESDEIFPEGVIGNYKPRDRALSLGEYHSLFVALAPNVASTCRRSAAWARGTRSSTASHPWTSRRTLGASASPERRPRQPSAGYNHHPSSFSLLLARAETTPLGHPIFPRWLNVRRDLEAACKRAGVQRVSPNDLRRTFASWQAEAGVPEAVTASLMGHTSSLMVRRVYGRIGSDAKREALAKLPPLAPPPGVMLPVIDESAEQSSERRRRQRFARDGTKKAAQNAASSSYVVPRDRIELPTRGFSILCSTD